MLRKLLDSLLKESSYPEPTTGVRLVETHVSFIFITDRFVYKVKKPVDFGFLDFSTLDRRRFYCHEEVRLNRRLCPDIYLGVVELRETPEGGSFVSGGKVLDYAVKMKRLPEERMLARLLERGEIVPEQMAELARFVAEFHGKAARGPQIEACGAVEVIRRNWEENFRQAAPFQERTIPARDLTLIRGWADRFLADNEELFRARVRGGFIRECDGDLHVENICLTDRICIFDCIEFNDTFRYTDTAADIAFLLMDLEYAGRPDLCPPFLDSYLAATGDAALLPLLPFYEGYRAFIRGKVMSLRLLEPGVPAVHLAEAERAAIRYFRLARGFALRERLAPSLIVTCGLMGSGKSTVARELAFQLGLPVAQSDAVRKGMAGAEAGRGGQAPYDGGIYTPSFNRATYDALFDQAREALSHGRGIVIDATFRRRGDRERFRRLAAESGASFHVIQTVCPEETVRERLEKRRLDRSEISDGRWELYHSQLAEFEAPAQGESIVVDTSATATAAVDQALKGMRLLP